MREPTELEIEYVEILQESWNNLLEYYEKPLEKSGYIHDREEDLRSLLFCKIFNLLEERGIPLNFSTERGPFPTISTEVRMRSNTRLDILLRRSEDSALGVEIKRNMAIENDLEKLKNFMMKKLITIGAFTTIVKRSQNLKTREMTPFVDTPDYHKVKILYDISENDNGSNNFITTKHIDRYIMEGTPNMRHIDWDGVLIILRNT